MIRSTLIILLFFPLFVFAQNDEDALKEAISLYKSEDYKTAISAFSNLVKKGYASDELYFNLASSYFKNDRLAEAVLYYEKALKLNPGHKPSKTNLTIVNNLRASDIAEIPDFFLLQWWNLFYNFMSSTYWLVISFLFLGGSLYFFYSWLFKSSSYRHITFTIIFFCLAILFLLASRSSYSDRYQNTHLVNIEAATLHSGPNSQSKELLEIVPGEKLKVIDRLGEWYQVILINKEQGWIHANKVKEI